MSGPSFFKRGGIAVALVFLLCGALYGGVDNGTAGDNKAKLVGKGPIVITSLGLSADKKANRAVFEGSVVARTNKMTLYADRMTVQYAEGGGIEVIDAEGHVRLAKDAQVITSGKARYLEAEKKVIFTETPRAVDGGNIVTGTRMIYLVEEDRSIVENSKVFLEQKKNR